MDARLIGLLRSGSPRLRIAAALAAGELRVKAAAAARNELRRWRG